MSAIDPALPTQLRWAANQVDAIVADPFWQAQLWQEAHYAQADGGSDMQWYLLDGSWASDMWVGHAATAHTQEVKKAAELVRTANRQLVALRDAIEREAQAAANQLEVQSLVDQLTNLLRHF